MIEGVVLESTAFAEWHIFILWIRAITETLKQVLQLVAKGLTNKEIGRVFGISHNTARNHGNSIIEKLEVSDRAQAATIAMPQGLISMTD